MVGIPYVTINSLVNAKAFGGTCSCKSIYACLPCTTISTGSIVRVQDRININPMSARIMNCLKSGNEFLLLIHQALLEFCNRAPGYHSVGGGKLPNKRQRGVDVGGLLMRPCLPHESIPLLLRSQAR